MAERFASPVSDTDEVVLRGNAIPGKTKATTEWGMRVWNDWASSRVTKTDRTRADVTTPLLQMPPEDLAHWMGKFVLEVRKVDGSVCFNLLFQAIFRAKWSAYCQSFEYHRCNFR